MCKRYYNFGTIVFYNILFKIGQIVLKTYYFKKLSFIFICINLKIIPNFHDLKYLWKEHIIQINLLSYSFAVIILFISAIKLFIYGYHI